MKAAKLGIGVIGVGGRGVIAQYAHRPEEGVRIVAGADFNPEHRSAFAGRYGLEERTYADYRQVLEHSDVDAVFVTTPDFLHEEHAIAALEAGKAVYLEKPMAITLDGCDRVLRTAAERKGRLYLGHNMRHMAFVRKMKELIDEGAIGEVKTAWCRHFIAYGGDAYFKDWHAVRENTMGLLLQKAAHDIDILHLLCGGYTERVVGMGSLMVYDKVTDRHGPDEPGDPAFRPENWPPLAQKGLHPRLDVEDVNMMMMALDNGVLCSYQQCHFTPDSWRNYTVIGDAGRIENYGDYGTSCEIRLYNQRGSNKIEGDVVYPAEAAAGSHGGADPAIVAEFVRYVREGGKVRTSPLAARNSVAAGYLATVSLRSGNAPQTVPPLDPSVRAYFEQQEAGESR